MKKWIVLIIILLIGSFIGCSKRRGVEAVLERVNESKTYFSYFIPLHIELRSEPMERFVTLPPLQGAAPRFGNLIMGNGQDSLITIVVDEIPEGEPRIFIDLNNNENLSDDMDGHWREESADMLRMQVIIQVEYIVSGERVLEPYAMEFYRFKNRMVDVVFASRLGYSIGTVSLDGIKYAVVISDDNSDALYDVRQTALIIDRNRDGQLDGDMSSAEFFGPLEPFNVRGKSYRLASVSPRGDRIVIAPVDSFVEPKAYLESGFPAVPIRQEASDGSSITLERFRGRVLLLDFWATWCEPCRIELPFLKEVYDAFHDRGFEILGISIDEDEAAFRQFIDDHDIEWPQIFDGLGWSNHVARQYRVMAVPTTYLLDRRGIIRYRNIRSAELKSRVEALLQDQETQK